MLLFTLKKMIRNKWMVSCLLLGAIVFVAVLSIIPTYSNGVYRHMLRKDLETQQIKSGEYPGNMHMSVMIKSSDESRDGFQRARDFEHLVENSYIPEMRLPVLASRKHYSLDRFFYHTRFSDEVQQISVFGIENFWEHVDIISGRKPTNDNTSSDVLEFVLSRSDYQRSDISLNQEFDLFTYALPRETDRQFGRAVCVGIFEPRYEEPFWFSDYGFSSITFILDYDYLVTRFVEPETVFAAFLSFYYCFDYTELRVEDIAGILNTTRRIQADIHLDGNLIFPMESTLRAYSERRDTLEFMLWILVIPVVTMLIFYIYMVSKLMINYESNEIAVLKSRGARNRQIFSVYALMSVFIAGLSLVFGPLLGLLAGRVLGLANGFMELVSRRGLSLELSVSSYLYATAAAFVFVLVMLIPALNATRDTIVKSKQKKSRRTSSPLWQKLWLDAVLIAISLYSLYLYRANSELRAISDVSGVETPVDPLILIASSMFVLGIGLLFIRLFPLIIKLIYLLGKRIWPPTIYSTLVSISRFRGSSRFLTLLLVFNLGLGLFNATAARTINRFLEERIRYENGADIVINQAWPVEMLFYNVEISDEGEVTYHRARAPASMPAGASADNDEDLIIYRSQFKEPPFDVFMNLDGVETATKVFTRDDVNIVTGHMSAGAAIMGIVPHEFGEIAWFRNDLLPTHIRNYLNVMTADSSAIILSSSMRDDYGFNVGDRVRVGWSEQSGSLDCTVYGFVDYWPSINPTLEPHFIIANLGAIHRQMRVEPYSVWMSLYENSSSLKLYESLNDAGVRVLNIRDTRQDIIAIKNDPLLQGLNGTLTLGFIVTLCITFIGFLIYWVLSIRSRLLQFGILRAMGLSRAGLIATLVWEQLLVSGSAVAAGFGAGVLASRLFVPTLQLIYSASEQVPPFLTTAAISDYIVLLFAFGGMLIAGLLVLTVTAVRLKPDQVLKLGED